MRISDCPHPNEQRAFRENAYLQWMTCLSCGVPLESKDGPGRHSGEDGTDNRTTSVDTSLSRMCLDDATTTDDKQNGDVLQMQSVHSCAKECYTHLLLRNTCFTVCALMFSSSAYGGAGDGTGLRFSGIGRELHNAECSSRIGFNTTGATIPIGQLRHLWSSGITGQEARWAIVRDVSKQAAEDQGEQGSSEVARHNAEDLNNTEVLQSVRVWTDKNR